MKKSELALTLAALSMILVIGLAIGIAKSDTVRGWLGLGAAA